MVCIISVWGQVSFVLILFTTNIFFALFYFQENKGLLPLLTFRNAFDIKINKPAQMITEWANDTLEAHYMGTVLILSVD